MLYVPIDESYYSSIMQDDGIHAILRYTHQTYSSRATVIKATNDIFVQFSNICFIPVTTWNMEIRVYCSYVHLW